MQLLLIASISGMVVIDHIFSSRINEFIDKDTGRMSREYMCNTCDTQHEYFIPFFKAYYASMIHYLNYIV